MRSTPAPTGWPQDARHRLWQIVVVTLTAALPFGARAAGTAAGTTIQNTATVNFSVAGTPASTNSNATSVTVAEILNVSVTLQSPTVTTVAGATNKALVFRVTNTGNSNEAFALAGLSALVGDDFDPVPATPFLYIGHKSGISGSIVHRGQLLLHFEDQLREVGRYALVIVAKLLAVKLKPVEAALSGIAKRTIAASQQCGRAETCVADSRIARGEPIRMNPAAEIMVNALERGQIDTQLARKFERRERVQRRRKRRAAISANQPRLLPPST